MPKQLFRNSLLFHAPSGKSLIVNKFSKAVIDKLGRMSEKGTYSIPKGCVCVGRGGIGRGLVANCPSTSREKVSPSPNFFDPGLPAEFA
jgi:hypothetical protein